MADELFRPLVAERCLRPVACGLPRVHDAGLRDGPDK